MSRLDPKISLSIVLAALLVGACGPVASSASKFVGAGGGSSSPTQNVNATTDTSSANVDEASIQETEIVTEDEFKQRWSDLSVKHPSMLFDDEDDLKTIKSSFQSNEAAKLDSTDARVEGSEATLAGPKSRIRHLLIVESGTKIKSLRLNESELRLVWVPKSKDKERYWELTLARPDVSASDPAIATNAETVRKALLDKLVGVAVEFEAEP